MGEEPLPPLNRPFDESRLATPLDWATMDGDEVIARLTLQLHPSMLCVPYAAQFVTQMGDMPLKEFTCSCTPVPAGLCTNPATLPSAALMLSHPNQLTLSPARTAHSTLEFTHRR
eukprot:scaffold310722_cov33-Tisochrysis_lutea.AAC.2